MGYGFDVWSNNSVMKTCKTVYHYNAVMMSAMASQITSVTIVYTTVYSGADQRKYQSSASLAFVWGIHRWPVNSPHKGPVTRKMFPFDDVIMPSKGSFVTEYLQYQWNKIKSIDHILSCLNTKPYSIVFLPRCWKICPTGWVFKIGS